MARRRKPLSPQTWLFGLVSTLAIIYISYQARVAVIQNFGEQQIARTQEAMQRIQQQQLERQRQAQQPVLHQAYAPQQRSMSAQEIQLERERVAQQKEAMRQRAEQERQKNEAWERFYAPTQACEAPESQARVDICTARETRLRKEFEQRWAAGKFSQPSGA
ncbi:hypothetical protein [Azotobacter beijerinckii]|uniref:Cell division protein FtsN n=1 Tax=Azotobacter beijerinckii TaxID=170623 RepID=A0A1I4H888_9GAMM|nr:hypothetical protein [Azotobacter beijerinckii]SFL38522.1 cell division protein FtsN [Azotobacter beijerinckii]